MNFAEGTAIWFIKMHCRFRYRLSPARTLGVPIGNKICNQLKLTNYRIWVQKKNLIEYRYHLCHRWDSSPEHTCFSPREKLTRVSDTDWAGPDTEGGVHDVWTMRAQDDQRQVTRVTTESAHTERTPGCTWTHVRAHLPLLEAAMLPMVAAGCKRSGVRSCTGKYLEIQSEVHQETRAYSEGSDVRTNERLCLYEHKPANARTQTHLHTHQWSKERPSWATEPDRYLRFKRNPSPGQESSPGRPCPVNPL